MKRVMSMNEGDKEKNADEQEKEGKKRGKNVDKGNVCG